MPINHLPHSRRHSERADSFEVHTCGLCPNAHLALKDKNGDIFADMTIGPDQFQSLMDGLKRAFGAARQENVERQLGKDDQ